MKYILCFILSISLAFAQPYRTGRVVIGCAGEVDCPRAVRVFKETARLIKNEVGLELEVVAVFQIPHSGFPKPNIRIMQFSMEAYEIRRKAKADAVVFFIRDIENNSINFEDDNTLGLSTLGTFGMMVDHNISYVQLMPDNFKSLLICKHEFGHLLGAPHDPNEGLMQPSMESVASSPNATMYSNASKDFIHDYLKTFN